MSFSQVSVHKAEGTSSPMYDRLTTLEAEATRAHENNETIQNTL